MGGREGVGGGGGGSNLSLPNAEGDLSARERLDDRRGLRPDEEERRRGERERLDDRRRLRPGEDERRRGERERLVDRRGLRPGEDERRRGERERRADGRCGERRDPSRLLLERERERRCCEGDRLSIEAPRGDGVRPRSDAPECSSPCAGDATTWLETPIGELSSDGSACAFSCV